MCFSAAFRHLISDRPTSHVLQLCSSRPSLETYFCLAYHTTTLTYYTIIMTAVFQHAPMPAHLHESQTLPRLRSNQGDYLNNHSVGYMKETPIDTPLDEMHNRFAQDGYLFVKGVMPREDVLDMREAYFQHMSLTGILKPGTSPRDGIFNDAEDATLHGGVGPTDLPDDQTHVKSLVSAHILPAYEAFVEHPKLRSFVRTFMGWKEEVLLKRTLLRYEPVRPSIAVAD